MKRAVREREMPVKTTTLAAPRAADSPGDPRLADLKPIVEKRLAALVPDTGGPSDAARHALLAPGKRLRAILTLAAAREFGLADPRVALDSACAIEMVHTASLMFDDLPAMDDAALRRGMPTAHVLFGVDVTILAGIGLLNGAFGTVAHDPWLNDAQKVRITRALSDAVGWSGLVQGQALDLSGGGTASLEAIQDGKTGVLFEAAALSGAAVAEAGEAAETELRIYSRHLGRAYQAFDDVLDFTGDDRLAGKSTCRDAGKLTALSGGNAMTALAAARSHLKAAVDCLTPRTDGEGPMKMFARHVLDHFESAVGSTATPRC